MIVRKLYLRYIVYLILCFSAVSIFRLACVSQLQKGRDFKEIREEGVLRVVTDYGVNSYYVKGDTIAGFQYEMAHQLAKHFNLKLEIFLENNLSECIEGLNERKYDLIARNIPVNSENKKTLLFSHPIVFDKQVLIQRTAQSNEGQDPIRNQIDLGQKTVYVPEDSPAILRLHNLSEEIADSIYIVEEQKYAAEQLVYRVVNKEIDYAVIDRQTALVYKKQFPALDIQTDIGFTQILSWAIRKESPALRDSINAWLKETKEH